MLPKTELLSTHFLIRPSDSYTEKKVLNRLGRASWACLALWFKLTERKKNQFKFYKRYVVVVACCVDLKNARKLVEQPSDIMQ
jgi:hypothetical protein